jgi:hypothetical protein
MPAQDYERGRFAIRDMSASSRSAGVVSGVADSGVTARPMLQTRFPICGRAATQRDVMLVGRSLDAPWNWSTWWCRGWYRRTGRRRSSAWFVWPARAFATGFLRVVANETAFLARVQDRRRTRFPKVTSPDILGGLGGQPVEVRSRKTKRAPLPAFSQGVLAVRGAGSRQDMAGGKRWICKAHGHGSSLRSGST